MTVLLRVATVDAPCELYVNEHPCLRLGQWGESARALVPCDLHLSGSQANLRIVVGVGATPTTASRAFDPPRTLRNYPSVSVVVELLEVGDPSEALRASGPTIVRLQVDDTTRDRTLPTELRATFSHAVAVAAPVSDPSLPRGWRQDAFAVARLFRGLLERGDVEALVSAHALKLEHYAAVHRQPLAQVRDGFAEFIRGKLDRSEWELAPIEEDRVDFRIVAGGRLVELVNVDWTPTLHFRRVSSPRSVAFLPTKLGRIGMTWRSMP